MSLLWSVFLLLSLSFPRLNGYLSGVFCLFAAPHDLADNMADSLCNIYVLISDARFRRIKGLARIHQHCLSITLGIAHHTFSLLSRSTDIRVYRLFRGAVLLHFPSQYFGASTTFGIAHHTFSLLLNSLDTRVYCLFRAAVLLHFPSVRPPLSASHITHFPCF